MSSTWQVLINPAAGRSVASTERVARALAGADVDAEITVAHGREHMASAIDERAGEDRLAVVGGDGTINLAVNVLLGRTRPSLPILGVLPAGTGCDLLRTFAIPTRMEDAAAHLATDSTYAIDIGEIEGSFGRRFFANVAEAGVGAAAVQTAERMGRRLGSARYPAAFAARLPGFASTEIELTTDRRDHAGPALAVIMANGQFFGGGWNVAPKATLVDGVFDLQVFDLPKRQAGAFVPKLMRGLHLTHPGVRRISAGVFELKTDRPWPVEVDGDFIGNTPVRGRVHTGAIQLKI